MASDPIRELKLFPSPGTGIPLEDIRMCLFGSLASPAFLPWTDSREYPSSPLFSQTLDSARAFKSGSFQRSLNPCGALGKNRAWSFWGLASVGLGVCTRESLVAPPWRMDGLAICPRGVPTPLWGPGSGDGSGLQGEGAGRKEAEAAWGGRVTVAMEGAARYSGIRILSAEKGGIGGRAEGGLGKVMGKPVSFLCPWHVPASPQMERSPHAPGAGPQQSPPCPACPPCVQKAEWPLPGGLFTSTTTAN